MNADLFKKVAPFLTSRSFQYHLQVVGYGLPSGRYRVLEAIIDLAGIQPQITYLRDLTKLGLPFRIDATAEAKNVAQVSKPAVSPTSKSARLLIKAAPRKARARAGLETCATPNPEAHHG